MNKEQFLTMSLPHELYAKRKNAGILKYNSMAYCNEFEIDKNNPAMECCIPVCHHLSDLTKPIEHNGEMFVPAEKIRHLRTGSQYEITTIGFFSLNYGMKHEYNTLPFEIIEWLIIHHFDIAGLIDKGEAIDVNTLPENPYK